jgi:hypothetical protein
MSIEEVREQFDLPRLESFNKYSEKYPPQHVLVAAYFGFGKEEKPKEATNEELAAIMAAFPQVQR